MINYKTPYYIVYEDKLRKNLDLITYVMQQSGAKIIMAFKANALPNFQRIWHLLHRKFCQ